MQRYFCRWQVAAEERGAAGAAGGADAQVEAVEAISL